MKHIQYPSITNHYQGRFIDKIKLEYPREINMPIWIVTEKIHGSNYSFWVDFYPATGAGYVKAAKRTSFIAKEESFFSHEPVFDRLNHKMFKMATDINKDIVIFGELFGGTYNGVSKGKIVQKGVQYHPYNDFMCFDIAKYTNGTPETLEFYPHDEVIALCKEFQIPHVPVLFKGTLQQCLNFSNDFNTKVPELYGFDTIEGNISEGVVIKPNKPLFLKAGERVILKSKNEKFKEIQKAPKSKKVASVFNDEVLMTIGLISMNLTETRMDGIISKYGEEIPFGEAMKLLLNDAIEDGCKDEYGSLDEEDQHIVNKALNKDLANIVKTKIVLKKKAG